MKKLLPILFALLLAVSCSQSAGRVIPEGTFVKIYADMVLADRWLYMNPESMAKADTSMVYEAVFNRYGYTTQDYLESVQYYINKPDKFSFLVTKAKDRLKNKSKEYSDLQKKAEEKEAAEKKLAEQADSLKLKKQDD